MSEVNKTTDAELDALFDSVLQCSALADESEVERLAVTVMDNERVGRPWRLTAVVAGKSGDFYRELSNDAEKAGALLEVIPALNEFVDFLRQYADLAEACALRLTVACAGHASPADWAEVISSAPTTPSAEQSAGADVSATMEG